MSYMTCQKFWLENKMTKAIKHYQDVFLPLVSSSEAIIQMNLTVPYIGNCQNPVHLSRLVDWNDPYVLFPVTGAPRVSPQLLVNGLITDL
jgi:hypothetical protein